MEDFLDLETIKEICILMNVRLDIVSPGHTAIQTSKRRSPTGPVNVYSQGESDYEGVEEINTKPQKS